MYYNQSSNTYAMSSPMYYHGSGIRNSQVVETIRESMKGEASSIDLYQQLVTIAPDQRHKNEILRILENKKTTFNHLANLYWNVTGTHLPYQKQDTSLLNYRDGLQKAYENEIKNQDMYQRGYLAATDPQVQAFFAWALTSEQAISFRISELHETVNQKADFGSEPFVVNINNATKNNTSFRTALWTGEHLQLTLMSIGVGEDIGLEAHPNTDQFLRIEEGKGLVQMGDTKERLNFLQNVGDDDVILIPAGKWHNLTNTGEKPLKLYSIYAPPEHPFGTIHETKAIAMAAEEHNH
ncbi:cupin domain-containing protein [Anaerobacillus alkaliphilus]|uniref:Cupin domain-containing protein n=2 Tax=Anaerobacillus alkaliphilus TaxID=1548597 RepID=A0A4Q0VNK7_9BACI|nr:cupin domain-containing protein [Anaerobacillus alkaliphilus]